jgi:hypothetical protein
MIEIDEKLVGDKVTRGFNAAKKDDKAFAEYKKLVATHGVTLTTRAALTLGDIAPASYDKKDVRKQEIAIISKATGISVDKLQAADSDLLASIKGNVAMTTEGSGYMLMARNRRVVQ